MCSDVSLGHSSNWKQCCRLYNFYLAEVHRALLHRKGGRASSMKSVCKILSSRAGTWSRAVLQLLPACIHTICHLLAESLQEELTYLKTLNELGLQICKWHGPYGQKCCLSDSPIPPVGLDLLRRSCQKLETSRHGSKFLCQVIRRFNPQYYKQNEQKFASEGCSVLRQVQHAFNAEASLNQLSAAGRRA